MKHQSSIHLPLTSAPQLARSNAYALARIDALSGALGHARHALQVIELELLLLRKEVTSDPTLPPIFRQS